MSTRPLLSNEACTPEVAQARNAFHSGIVAEVAAAVAKDPVVIVGMTVNPHVKKARKALDAAGIPYTYLGYGGYASKWRERLAIKMWSGWPTFPQVFVKGVLIGGGDRTAELVESGELKRWLEQGPPKA